VLFYPPGCSPRIAQAQAPLLVLIGELDGGAPSCVAMSRRLTAGGGPPVAMVTYPNTHHGFDAMDAVAPTPGQGAERLLTVQYNAEATADARRRVRAFLAEQPR
jgi:dienelactone hydrolase